MRARRFSSFLQTTSRKCSSRPQYHARLRLEPLEDRRLLSVGATQGFLPGGIEWRLLNSPPTPPVDTSGSIVTESSGLAGTPVILSEVPTSTWTYGCTATAAGMMFGYYDRAGYPDMYTGPANGGLAPLNDLGQGNDPDNPIAGACSIIATQQGFDGRTTPGHVDDYWVSLLSEGPDPWEATGIEHVWGDCTADFLGTSQWKWDFDGDGVKDHNLDGATQIKSNVDGTPLFDYIPPAESGLPQTDGCHGLRLFAESRGYAVETNYTQQLDTVATGGFSFGDLMAEIDAGRPVLSGLRSEDSGHSILIVGYNTTGNTIYIHDTWDNETHWMTWGGEYAEMTQTEVIVLHLEVAPTADAGGPYTIAEGDEIALSAKNSSDPTGSIVSYAWDLDNDGEYDDGNEPTATFVTKIPKVIQTENGPKTEFIYKPQGVYTVGLQVTGTSGESDTDTVTITVVNAAPTISFGGTLTVNEGSNLLLEPDIADPGGDPMSPCFWDLDADGVYDEATGDTANFNRTADGTYTVGVKVLDNHTTLGLIAANSDSGTVSVLRNLGGGALSVQETCAVDGSPYGVVAADFDADGNIDLATASHDTGVVSILINRGDGAYLDCVTFDVGNEPLAIIAADLDADGDADLATANRRDGSVSVLINEGDDFRPQAVYPVGKTPFSVAAADVNGDHKLDLVTANQGDGTVSVLLNQGGGTFAPQVAYVAGDEPVSIAAADLNGDNAVDLAVANYRSDTVSVLLNKNDGTGKFASRTAYAVGSRPRAVVAADVDGDGAVDLVAANSLSDTISVLENQGAGAFAPQLTAAVGRNPYSVVVCDLDADGTPELATANRGSDSVSVLRRLVNGTYAIDATHVVGAVPVSLIATDMIAGIGTATATITVENVAPTAYAGGPYSVDLGKAVRLSAAGTLDPGNDVVSYEWDLDADGQYDDATGQVVYHTPAEASDPSHPFTISVRVTDDDGATGVASAELTVFDPEHIPTFIPGDANRDGAINTRDAAILMAHWGLSGMSWTDGDFNGDGVVNADDATILTSHWGGPSGNAAATGGSTAGSVTILATVGPLRSAPAMAARRAVRSATSGGLPPAAMNPAEGSAPLASVGQAVPDSAGAATASRSSRLRGEKATDAALAEFGQPSAADSGATFAWSRTLARRQLRRDAQRPAGLPLATDLVLSDPSA